MMNYMGESRKKRKRRQWLADFKRDHEEEISKKEESIRRRYDKEQG